MASTTTTEEEREEGEQGGQIDSSGQDTEMSGPESEGEHAVTPKVAKEPGQPSAQEIADRAVTHLPYRSWCPHCVKARGPDEPHRARCDPQEVPVFGFDYLSAKDIELDDDGKKDEVKVIVAYLPGNQVRVRPRHSPERS